MLRVVDLGVSIGRIQIVRNAAIDLREGGYGVWQA